MVVLEYPLTSSKVMQKTLKVFTIYGHGSHIGDVTGTVCTYEGYPERSVSHCITLCKSMSNTNSKRVESTTFTNHYTTMAQMGHFSFPYYFTVPNSEFQIPTFALPISEFGIVKYMKCGQVVTAYLL